MKTDQELDDLETVIPELADYAMRQACKNALTNGQSVLQVQDGIIYEVFPDGKKMHRKTITPKIPVIKKELFIET
ncbi:MAG: hypothetical protein JKY23_04060 [Nitrospinaceae bacterium]|nr:hypothetical protein [Nitrospinaceae bacterium]